VIETATGSAYSLFQADDTEAKAFKVGEGQPVPTGYDPAHLCQTQLPRADDWNSGTVLVSLAMLQDSGIDIGLWLASALGIRIARGAGESLISTLLAAAHQGAVALGNLNDSGATAADSCGLQDIKNLIASVDPAYRASPKAGFLLNSNTMLAIDSLTSTTGQPLIQPVYVNGQRYLLGYPANICPSLPDIGDSVSPVIGNACLVFGDLGRFIIRRVAGSGALVRMQERYIDQMECGFLSHARLSAALLCAAGTDSPVKYLSSGVASA
jgi:HK97 family phage major capsid protein